MRRNSAALLLGSLIISSSCNTLQHRPLKQQLQGLQPPVRTALLWRGCPSKKNGTWDGGGTVRWQGPKLSLPPGLQLDWLFEPPQLAVELSHIMGGVLWSFVATSGDIRKQRLHPKLSNFGPPGITAGASVAAGGMLHFYGRSTGLTAEEWGCLLAFSLPASWQNLPAHIDIKADKSEAIRIKAARRHIKLNLHFGPQQPRFCAAMKWWGYLGLVSHRSRVCFQGDFLNPAPLKQNTSSSLSWSYRSSDGWMLSWKPT